MGYVNVAATEVSHDNFYDDLTISSSVPGKKY
jgi:hypothetical protein